MDRNEADFAAALKADAEAISAEVTPALAARLARTSTVAAARDRAAPPPRAARVDFSTWWMSTLTGAAVAVGVIVFLNVTQTGEEQSLPNPVVQRDLSQLEVTPATFTEPLEDEWRKLKNDLDKVADDIEDELRASF